MQRSRIGWCEKTVNPFSGCQGCELGRRCYALTMAWRLAHIAKTKDRYAPLVKKVNGVIRWSGKHFFRPDILRDAVKRDTPTTFFVGSMGDIALLSFEEKIELFRIIADAKRHRFQLLTKWPEWIKQFMQSLRDRGYRQNMEMQEVIAVERRIALGVSVTNQETADQRIGQLLAKNEHGIPYWQGKTFVSLEPLLGPIIIDPELLPRIDQVIVGCKSGHGARPTRLEWVRQLRDPCVANDVPFFLKQLRGYLNPSEDGAGSLIHKPVIDGQQHLRPLWKPKEESA